MKRTNNLLLIEIIKRTTIFENSYKILIILFIFKQFLTFRNIIQILKCFTVCAFRDYDQNRCFST